MTTLQELLDLQSALILEDEDSGIFDRGEMYLRFYSSTSSAASPVDFLI
ncbi:MAG: hypothetical protein ACRBDL_08785 [Alphaproteobacteria bacterium]